jgi:LysM repeat protein
MCSIERVFERLSPKLSVALDRHLVMNTAFDDRTDRTATRAVSFPRRSQMSTIAVAPGFGSTRTAVRRPARPATPRTTSLHLTRRGRLVFLAAFIAMVFAALTVFGGQSAATGEAGAPVQTRTVEVAQGDTLWAIASTVAEPGEVREMIHQIQELNALTSASLVVGQEIAVPVG